MKSPLTQGQPRSRLGTAARVTGLVLVAVATGALATAAHLAGIQLGIVVLLVPVAMTLLAGASEPSDEYPGSYDGHYDDHRYDEHDHEYHYSGRS